jgi:hypothetical protein
MSRLGVVLPSTPAEKANEMLSTTELWMREVLRAVRPLVPKDPAVNGTLTLLIRGGRLRADFTSQVREDGWTDASR